MDDTTAIVFLLIPINLMHFVEHFYCGCFVFLKRSGYIEARMHLTYVFLDIGAHKIIRFLI